MTNLTETASQFGAKVSEAQERVEDLGRMAGRKLDEARNDTAGALHTVASSVRSTARRGIDAADGMATGAADKLDASGSYVANHDLRSLFGGCRDLIRQHPAGSFMVAAAVGFCMGSAVRHITHSCVREPAGRL